MNDGPIYSVDEARALVPQIRGTLLQLAMERHRAEAAHVAMHRSLDGIDEASDDRARDQFEAATAEHRALAGALLDHLESLGVVVRDLDDGLVDIPTIRDGERAWLCWRLDDPELAFWHTTRQGYGSRQPL